jgi:probable F420-dependent oxidoreductase
MGASIGIAIFPTEQSIRPAHLARELESRGFESMFVPDHTHIPVHRSIPWPLHGELPETYGWIADPFVAMSAAAAVTERLKVGTGVCLIPQRDPIVTAKSVSSLDRFSEGRVVFGIGTGWNVEEMLNHGTNPENKWPIMREKVLAMQCLWRDEVAAFSGEFVQITPSWCRPKPVQKPNPPVLIGAPASKRTFKHIVEYADGWIPIGDQPGYGYPGNDLGPGITHLRQLWGDAGRDPARLQISVHGAVLNAERMEYYDKLGADRVTTYIPPAPADEVLPLLDEYMRLLSR